MATPRQYDLRPPRVDAIQWEAHDGSTQSIRAWLGSSFEVTVDDSANLVVYDAREGFHVVAHVGDYVCQETDRGRVHVLPRGVFHKHYAPSAMHPLLCLERVVHALGRDLVAVDSRFCAVTATAVGTHAVIHPVVMDLDQMNVAEITWLNAVVSRYARDVDLAAICVPMSVEQYNAWDGRFDWMTAVQTVKEMSIAPQPHLVDVSTTHRNV